jgi:hypothetical protein
MMFVLQHALITISVLGSDDPINSIGPRHAIQEAAWRDILYLIVDEHTLISAQSLCYLGQYLQSRTAPMYRSPRMEIFQCLLSIRRSSVSQHATLDNGAVRRSRVHQHQGIFPERQERGLLHVHVFIWI